MIHDWHKEVFATLLASRQRHHALLLNGPPGIGKSALALELAAAGLCEQRRADGSACRVCNACGWFLEGNHPDFRHVVPAALDERADAGDGGAASGDADSGTGTDGGSGRAAPARGGAARSASGKGGRGARASREIRIDQIRALDTFLEVGAHRGGERVIVIDPADAMNTITANALLKRLEEPPSRTAFILVASRPASLPATVRSRCRQVSLSLPAVDAAIAWLVGETGAGRHEAGAWLAASAGAPLHALRFADESEAAAHRRIVDAFAGLPEAGIVTTAEALSRVEPSAWAVPAQSWASDLVRVRAGAAPRRHADRHERLRRLAAQSSLERLLALEDRLRLLGREASHPLNARLLLEDVLLDFHRALA